MDTKRVCGKCGAELTGVGAGLLCPGCLLEGGLDVVQSPVSAAAGGIATIRLDLGQEFPEHPQTGMFALQKFGDYELLEEIARGGMGVVYKARQLSLDRIVAVKMLLFGPLAKPEFVQRFRTEATAAGSLHHPHIVSIHEVGIHQGQHYLVMDFVSGPSLARLVADQPLPGQRAAGYVKTIAEAIQYAHDHGVLHRDLKPSNVLMDENDHPKVTDFGLAKWLDKETELTLSGQVLGSPNYMPPEQAAAHRGLVGKRSDVYSLGAILYHLLTGRAPFVAPTIGETLQQVQTADPVSPTILNPHLPRDLKTICLKCLEKAPARRYQTAQDLADDLGRWLRKEPIFARPVSRPEKIWRWCRRKPVIATLSLFTLLLLLAVAIGSPIALFHINKHRHQAEQNAGDLRLSLYAAEMSQAFRAWDIGNLNVANALLNAQRPQPGGTDLRGTDWRWLWSLCRSEAKAVLPQSAWQIYSAEPSPDGRRVATAGWSTNVVVYDLAGKDEPQVLSGHTRYLMGFPSIAYSPDGRRLASSSGGFMVEPGPCEFFLWDLATTNRTVLQGHDVWLLAVAFSPDGAYLASACLDGTVGLWDGHTGRNLAIMRGHQKPVYALAFSKDSQWLFSGGEDGTVRRWDVAARQEVGPPLRHELAVGFVAASPDGRLIATACTDNHLRLWDVTSGQVRKLRYSPAEGVRAPAFSPDGRLLAFGTGNNIRLWDLQLEQEKTVLRGAPGAIASLRFLPDGKQLVSASEFERPMLWDLDRPEKLDTLGGGFREGVHVMAICANRGWLAVGSGDALEPQRAGEVIVFDMVAKQPLLPSLPHPQGLNSVSMSADGRLLATGCPDGSVRVFTLPQGKLLRTLTNVVVHKGGSLILSPDGRSLVTCGGFPERIAVWDSATWKSRSLLGNPPGPPQGFAFSPDGSLLATPMSVAMTTLIWDIPAGTTNRLLRLNDHGRGAAFSADGSMLAIYGFFNIELFQVKPWKHLGTLKGHQHVINDIAFAPDGKILASVGVEGSVRLWSVPAREEVAALYDHRDSAEAVAFTPDGQWLVSGSRDKTVKLRRIPSFEEIQVTERRERAAAARDRALRADDHPLSAENLALRARDPGAIRQWLLLLPIPMEDTDGIRALQTEQVRRESRLRPRAGERTKVGRTELAWRTVQLEDYLIDFNDLAGAVAEFNVAYAVAYLESETAQKGVLLKVGSDDQARVYLNGKLVYQCTDARPCTVDQDAVSGLELNAGINVVVFKVVNQAREWQGSLWFTDAAGQPLKGMKVTLAPAR